MNEHIFEQKPTLKQKIWYYLTWWRPITKKEILHLQKNIVIIFEGMREGDLQHFQIERTLEGRIRKIESPCQTQEKKEINKDNMFG